MSLPAVTTERPEDPSGRRSRGGYQYQDLCALRYCLKIAEDRSWLEVWCESHDDIVLYRLENGGDRYRFIQVKYRFAATQHWSCAELCSHPADRDVHDSVLGKLFGKDRFEGASDFRLATNEGASDHLQTFLYRWNRQEAVFDAGCAGARELRRRLGGYRFPKGKSADDYLSRFAIERHAADADDMEAALAQELSRFLCNRDYRLLPDEVEMVLRFLYSIVFRAATTDLDSAGSPEKIAGSCFHDLVRDKAALVSRQTVEAAGTEPGELLRSQLEAVGMNEAFITTAAELRRQFYSKWRRSSGTAAGEALEVALGDVQALCAVEGVRAVEDPSLAGAGLLRTILERIVDYHRECGLGKEGVSIGLLHGMCYFLIARNRLQLS